MGKQYNLNHLRINSFGEQEFVSPRKRNDNIPIPERDRQSHAENIKLQINELKKDMIIYNKEYSFITVEGKKNYKLQTKSLNSKRLDTEVLRNDINKNNEEYAVLRISNEKGFDGLIQKVDDYKTKNSNSGKPKNKNLIESIERLRKSKLEDLWGSGTENWPDDPNQKVWWELWLFGGTNDINLRNKVKQNFIKACNKLRIKFYTLFIDFPERQVTLLKVSIHELEFLIDEFDQIVELDLPSNIMLEYGMSNNLITSKDYNIEIKNIDSKTRIAIIDTGVNYNNQYLCNLINEKNCFNVDGINKPVNDYKGHGTNVAGIAAFGDINNILNKDEVKVPYLLESIRIELDEDGSRRELWGAITKKAVDIVEKTDTEKINRIFNMSIGSGYLKSFKPTSWSSEIDSLCYNAGKGRLITIAAGNVSTLDNIGYTSRNLATSICEPSNALNCICVGGYTALANEQYLNENWKFIANAGEISPFTTTGIVKKTIKPDLLYEAGNAIYNGQWTFKNYPGISILTTSKDITEQLELSEETSMAAPGVARELAIIWHNNSDYMPTTIRGLLIHSCNITKPMENQFLEKQDRLRACGYGIPNLEFACRSAKSSVCMIDEGNFQFYMINDKNEVKKNMIIYKLPWPKDKLIELGELKVILSITLSFFIEPNPKVQISNYEGGMLAWDIQVPFEDEDEFLKRVNKVNRNDQEEFIRSGNSLSWAIGVNARNRGTVQSDYVEITAAQLASCGVIAIYSKDGWWKKLPKGQKLVKEIPYSLIISIESEDEDINLYNLVENEINIKNKVSIEIDNNEYF